MSEMTSIGATGLSDYNSRIMAIEVTGLCRQDVMRTSNYKFKVPYGRLSQTMQRINRIGGKVKSVTMVSSFLTEAKPAKPESDSVTAEPPMTSQTTKTDITEAAQLEAQEIEAMITELEQYQE